MYMSMFDSFSSAFRAKANRICYMFQEDDYVNADVIKTKRTRNVIGSDVKS